MGSKRVLPFDRLPSAGSGPDPVEGKVPSSSRQVLGSELYRARSTRLTMCCQQDETCIASLPTRRSGAASHQDLTQLRSSRSAQGSWPLSQSVRL